MSAFEKDRAGRAYSRKLAFNFVFLSTAEAAVKLLTIAAFTVLGRRLGPERYGTLEFVLAIMAIVSLFVDLGLNNHGAKAIARGSGDRRRLVGELVALRMLLGCVAMACVLVLSVALPLNQEGRTLLAFYGLSLLPLPFLLPWLFQGFDMMRWVAAASLVRYGLFSVGVLLLMGAGAPLALVGLIEAAAVTAAALLCLAVARKALAIRAWMPKFDAGALWGHLREALPIGGSELGWACLWFAPLVVLGFAGSDSSVGEFGAGHRVLTALHSFIYLYFFNLLPTLTRSAQQPRAYLEGLLGSSLRVAAWIGLLAGFLLCVLSRELLVLAYGAKFEGGADALGILVWVLPVAFLSGHYRFTLIGWDCQRVLFWCTAASAVVSVVLSVLLIPRSGPVGAAWALLVAMVLNFAAAYWAVARRIVPVPLASHLARPLLALAVAYGCFHLLRDHSLALGVSVSASVYLAILAMWERWVIERLWEMMRGRREAAA